MNLSIPEIILIDDNGAFCKAFHSVFGSLFKLVTVKDESELLEKLQVNTYDGVILNFIIHEQKTIEILKKIREIDFGTPIITFGLDGVNRKTSHETWDFFNEDLLRFAERERFFGLIKKAVEAKASDAQKKISDLKFRRIVENSREAICIIQDKCFVFVNKAFNKITGYSLEKDSKFGFIDVVHPLDKEKIADNHRKRLEGRKVASIYSFRILTADKKVVWIEVRVESTEWMGKQAFLVFFHDISRRIEFEKALLESEEKYRSLIERASDGIAIIRDRKFIFVNHSMTKLCGFSREELLDTPFTDYVYPGDLKRLIKIYEDRFRGKDVPSIYETSIINKSGKRVYLEVNAGLIPFEGGTADLVFFRNVSERKKNEKLIRDKNRELKDFSYRISHDIKGPVSSIRAYAELIKDDASCSAECAEKIMELADNVTDFINRLLKLSKAGKVLGPKKGICCRELVNKVFQSVKKRGVQAELKLGFESHKVSVDPQAMEEVIFNLIDNSVKYHDPDKKKLIIDMSCDQNEKFNVMIYRDNGRGIDKKHKQDVFSPGYALEKKKGTGFGLAIVKKLIEAHEGTIELVPRGIGNGVEFRISLPR